jgi:hypothetical protein
MANHLKLSVMVTSYVDPPLRQRMLRVQKRKPRLTISKQVAQCVEAYLPQIETAAGLKPRTVTPE